MNKQMYRYSIAENRQPAYVDDDPLRIRMFINERRFYL